MIETLTTIRKGKYIKVVFSDNTSVETDECTDAINKALDEENDEEKLKEKLSILINGEYHRNIEPLLEKSNILTRRGMSVYMLSVSELTIPEDFALRILEAELSGNQEEVNKYINFWTLVSMNPDSRVRNNLFWFIRKWNMEITQSGFVVGYRNVDLKERGKFTPVQVKDIINTFYTKKYIDGVNPNEESIEVDGRFHNLEEAYNEVVNNDCGPVFTDRHSHSFTIKLGQPVSMPREECDSDQEHSCSQGLHIGAKGWLKQNYYGGYGLQCLVNPAKVVAIPTIDSYGKMRCCEYLPVAMVSYNDEGDLVEPKISLHSDIQYLKEIKDSLYKGEINNKDVDNYEISVGNNLTREEMYDSILQRIKPTPTPVNQPKKEEEDDEWDEDDYIYD